MTEQFPDDVEAWIELAGILEETNITVSIKFTYFSTIFRQHDGNTLLNPMLPNDITVHIYMCTCVSI